ncbi:alpha/beta hydrolase fold domain-containing protein [Prosthecobacter sp.]|uniref:alpha/beta hydrolase fold domain-containing protein n=1 Tax=Prosthecobacter sp. TaxID=1965333 RepID=UPI003784FB1E
MLLPPRILTLLTALLLTLPKLGHSAPDLAPTHADIVYAKVDDRELKLDLYLPKDAKKPPLVVFIHGGGWKAGSYKSCSTSWLTESGFAVASISYRLSQVAVFPAQIHDCKGAIRWLRAHAAEYGYDATRVGVAGTSAGGHLVLLLGTTGGVPEYEGTVGGNLDQSSAVQAVADYFGPSDFILRSENQPIKTEDPKSTVFLLLGGPVKKNLELARFASPVFQVNAGDAPLLIIHGDKDATVHLDQSQRMVDVYRQAGLEVALQVVPGGGHGGAAHFTPPMRDQVSRFFIKHLRSNTP